MVVASSCFKLEICSELSDSGPCFLACAPALARSGGVTSSNTTSNVRCFEPGTFTGATCRLTNLGVPFASTRTDSLRATTFFFRTISRLERRLINSPSRAFFSRFRLATPGDGSRYGPV